MQPVQGHRWFVLTLIILTGCSSKKLPSNQENSSVPVNTIRVQHKTMPVLLKSIGTVQVYASVQVRSRVAGELLAVHFREGQDVRKGDLLFEIDPRPYQEALNLASANWRRDQAHLRNAEGERDRLSRLTRSSAVAREEYDRAVSTVASLKASVDADRAAIESARLRLDYCRIHSPIDGKTGSLLIHPGNLLKAEDITPLVIINQVSPVAVCFSVPEQHLGAIADALARNARLRVDAFTRVDKIPLRGELTFIDNAVDPTTGMIQLKAEFPNKKRRLWPGQFVDVVLHLDERPNSLVVPSDTIQTGQNGLYVYVVTPEQTVVMQSVKVHGVFGDESIIASGLKGDEVIVRDGHLRLAPNVRVAARTDAPLASLSAVR